MASARDAFGRDRLARRSHVRVAGHRGEEVVAVERVELRRGDGSDGRRSRHVALGGDRTAVETVAARLPWLADKRLERFFTVPEPRQRVLEALPYDLYSVELQPP